MVRCGPRLRYVVALADSGGRRKSIGDFDQGYKAIPGETAVASTTPSLDIPVEPFDPRTPAAVRQGGDSVYRLDRD